MATIEERLSALEKKVALLESSFKVDNGLAVVKAQNKVLINAPVLELEGAAAFVMKGGSVDVNASMNLNLKSAAVAHVQGALVRLNGGHRAVAYSGSHTIPLFPSPMQKVDEGNLTVLV